MKRYFLFVTALLYTSSLFSALPPFYQSRSEIYSLISNSEVEKKLGPVSSIKGIKKEDNIYTIETIDCSLKVTIKYLPRHPGKVGPSKFKFIVGDLVCKN